jgi:hypothetical protein
MRKGQVPATAPELELTVRDDGLGIDPQRPKAMAPPACRERVKTLGGRYILDSEEGPRHLRVHHDPVGEGGDNANRRDVIGGAA